MSTFTRHILGFQSVVCVNVFIYLLLYKYLNLESSFEGKDDVCERLLLFLLSDASPAASDKHSFQLMEALLYRVHLNLFTGRLEGALAILQVSGTLDRFSFSTRRVALTASPPHLCAERPESSQRQEPGGAADGQRPRPALALLHPPVGVRPAARQLVQPGGVGPVQAGQQGVLPAALEDGGGHQHSPRCPGHSVRRYRGRPPPFWPARLRLDPDLLRYSPPP